MTLEQYDALLGEVFSLTNSGLALIKFINWSKTQPWCPQEVKG